MAEPASSTAGVAIAAGTITVSGSFIGVQYDLLLAGFAGGLVSLSYLPAMTRWRIAGSVASSAILAGFVAPVLAVGALHYLPWVSSVGDFIRMVAAFGLGICAQVLIPAALNGMQRLIAAGFKRLDKILGGH